MIGKQVLDSNSVKGNHVYFDAFANYRETYGSFLYDSIRRPERARQNQTLHHAAVAHLVERHLAKVEVASSSLVGRSISEIWFQAAGLHLVQALQANQVGSFLCGPVVQLVRTLACHARGRQFEPDPGRHYASVAQSVEQGTENPRVIGSIPIGGTTCFAVSG